ncbi:hypothetical protein ACFO0D_02370 [Deinococcus hohokamensis]|uniref:Uncharacterized protein n=1 Tax=Deinococcus hohokamensis TaxID=309883 RepID=A0ABV9I5H9_9DEIO
MTVSAQPRQLRAQASENLLAPLQISAPLSIETFTDTAARVRHIRATFRITNPNTRRIELQSLNPIVLRDLDGDPTNNGAQPTIRETPFRNVRLYDGSDAAAQAEALQPTRGQIFNPLSGMPEVDIRTTPFVRDFRAVGLDPDTLVVPAPEGLAVAVKNYGWLGSPLAPGASINVTFAVDLPNINPSKPAADPYSFSLVFTAVESTTPQQVFFHNAIIAAESYRLDGGPVIDAPASCTDARVLDLAALPDGVNACQIIQTATHTYGYMTTSNNVSYQYDGTTFLNNTAAEFPQPRP